MAEEVTAERLNPREVTDTNWIWVYGPGWSREKIARQPGWDRSGKWLIFLDRYQVELDWAKIRAATEAGQLGFRAKVSTAKENQFTFSDHVIEVYNQDADDYEEVIRIREVLREMGFGVEEKLYYKREATTQAGIYHGGPQGMSASMIR